MSCIVRTLASDCLANAWSDGKPYLPTHVKPDGIAHAWSDGKPYLLAHAKPDGIANAQSWVGNNVIAYLAHSRVNCVPGHISA